MEKTKKAFTLVEMLVVIVIIGIVLAIAIPNVANVISGNQKNLYQTHMKIVEEATNLFVNQYKGQLTNDSASCFQVNYQTLLQKDLIKETKVFCTGNIILTKSGNQKNFTPSYYLD